MRYGSVGNSGERGSIAFLLAIVVVIAAAGVLTFVIVRKISSRSPLDSDAVVRLVKKKKFEEALALVDRIDANSYKPTVMIDKGRIWLSMAVESQNKVGWRDYGKNDYDWFQSAQIDSALSYFKRALLLDPDNTTATYWAGLIYLEKGWYDDAQAAFETALEDQTYAISARVSLAALFSQQRDFNRAEEILHEAYRIDQRDPLVAKNLMILNRFYLKRQDSAVIWANRFLNNAHPRDFDRNIAKSEMKEMLSENPGLEPAEPMLWKTKKRFKKRGFKFQE